MQIRPLLGRSEVHETSEGPLLVYFAPDQPVREMALIGIWLDRAPEPFVLYEDRETSTPPEFQFNPRDSGYEAPQDWLLMWPAPWARRETLRRGSRRCCSTWSTASGSAPRTASTRRASEYRRSVATRGADVPPRG